MATKTAEKPAPKCDNHPDVDATFSTDGTLHNVQNFCDECREAQRP